MSEYTMLQTNLLNKVGRGELTQEEMLRQLEDFSTAHHAFEPDVDAEVLHTRIAIEPGKTAHIHRGLNGKVQAIPGSK